MKRLIKMVLIDNKGYLFVKEHGRFGHSVLRNIRSRRDWWIGRRVIGMAGIRLPKKFWGKRIRFKIEVVEE